MTSPPRDELGTVVVRAWIEAGADPSQVHARVLLVREGVDVPVDLGAARGMERVLDLVRDALLGVGSRGRL